jgi:hypothetical protein
MTNNIDEARKRLSGAWIQSIPDRADIRAILDALDAAERERDEAREAAEANHLDGERNYERYKAALAVIERAKARAENYHSKGEGPFSAGARDMAMWILHDLDTAPADALRAAKAEAIREAINKIWVSASLMGTQEVRDYLREHADRIEKGGGSDGHS